MPQTAPPDSAAGPALRAAGHKRARASTPRGAEAEIRLLLVEDSFELVELLTKLLSRNRSAKFIVRATNSLQQGVRAASRANFDVVLLDLTLPDSAGGETYRRLRAAAPTLPIIILSAHDDEELAVRLVQEGAQDYFLKGAGDIHLLPRAIRYAIERHRAERALEAERDLLRAILDSLPEMIYALDLEGRCIFSNSAHARLGGAAQPREISGCTESELIESAQAAELDCDDRRAVDTACGHLRPAASKLQTRDADAENMRRSSVPLLDGAGEVIARVVSVRELRSQFPADSAAGQDLTRAAGRNDCAAVAARSS